MRTARDGGEALLAALRSHGGTVGRLADEAAVGELGSRPGPAQVAASGPRASDHPDDYELLLEIIAEGSHLHYGPQRIVRTEDQDLALLLGDQLYALGLARLAAIGDREAVTELADAISLVAQAQAASDPDLAEAAWQAGAVAVGWGSSDRHAAAKRLARAGDSAARGALRSAALVPSS